MSNVVAQLLGAVLRCVLKPRKRKPAPQNQDAGAKIEDRQVAEGDRVRD